MKHVIAWPADLGHLIRSERLARGLSQRSLAHSIGRSLEWLERIELGEDRHADLHLIDQLVAELRLDPIEVASHTGSLFRSAAHDGRTYFRARCATFMAETVGASG